MPTLNYDYQEAHFTYPIHKIINFGICQKETISVKNLKNSIHDKNA